MAAPLKHVQKKRDAVFRPDMRRSEASDPVRTLGDNGQDPDAAARIGPNALSQTAHALDALFGPVSARDIFAQAGLAERYDTPPEAMVDETEPARLFADIDRRLGRPTADLVLADAGSRTGAYLLANRIPPAARTILRALPAGLSARLLCRAIAAHAWTFCGSGEFAVRVRGLAAPTITVTIRNNPLASPGCPWHRAVFRHLFTDLLCRPVDVAHPACCSTGDECCTTIITMSA